MQYEQHEVDSKGWTDWIKPMMKGYKIRCCDCDLVHVFDFKVENNRQIKFKVKRDNRATAASRRTKRR